MIIKLKKLGKPDPNEDQQGIITGTDSTVYAHPKHPSRNTLLANVPWILKRNSPIFFYKFFHFRTTVDVR